MRVVNEEEIPGVPDVPPSAVKNRLKIAEKRPMSLALQDERTSAFMSWPSYSMKKNIFPPRAISHHDTGLSHSIPLGRFNITPIDEDREYKLNENNAAT